jgi:excinuclease UvrABC helicase subunit UvrB
LPAITKKRYQAIALNEKFSELIKEKGIKTEYLHSEVKTLERIKIHLYEGFQGHIN